MQNIAAAGYQHLLAPLLDSAALLRTTHTYFHKVIMDGDPQVCAGGRRALKGHFWEPHCEPHSFPQEGTVTLTEQSEKAFLQKV